MNRATSISICVLLSLPSFAMAQSYTPQESATVGAASTTLLGYQDITMDTRVFQVAWRFPEGLMGAQPVVVWSHGGAAGQTNATNVLPEWAAKVVQAGFVSVSIAHTGRDQSSREALCTELGIPLDTPSPSDLDCQNFKHLNFDRPFDIRRALNFVEDLALAEPDRVDASRIVVAGHSSGSGGTLSVAGAARQFAAIHSDLDDPRPLAFMAFSPQGPGVEGMFDTDHLQPDHSWENITRPVLVGTGAGDNSCTPRFSCDNGSPPRTRRIPFQRMPAGDKYLMYIRDVQAAHVMFGMEVSACMAQVDPARCMEFEDWLGSSAHAFLDAYLRDNAAALQWLDGELQLLTGGDVEWSSK
ncbi:MAG: hypothetical protein DHS20C11_08650 [Lysobacteraceae bacterium]|nr:MAG: hypothetical protein DHS20C11_08650 [Xanthomonadaceae bacterium]